MVERTIIHHPLYQDRVYVDDEGNEIEIEEKGGAGSGNWGHQGLAGTWGGSSSAKRPELASDPIVDRKVYHGSNEKFDNFETGREMVRVGSSFYGGQETKITTSALFFSKTPHGAKFFAEDRKLGFGYGGLYLYEVDINIKNPLDMTMLYPELLILLDDCGFEIEPFMLDKDIEDEYERYDTDNVVGLYVENLFSALEDSGIVKELSKRGYDGAVLLEQDIPDSPDDSWNEKYSTYDSNVSYAVFSPEQVRIRNISKFEHELFDFNTGDWKEVSEK